DETKFPKVGIVHQHYKPRSVDAAQAVLIAVDRCVERVVAADGDQCENVLAPLRKVGILGKTRRCDERRLTGFRLPLTLACRVRTVKYRRLCNASIESAED